MILFRLTENRSKMVKCCIIGSTQVAIDCSKIIIHHGFAIAWVFTDDHSFKKWTQKIGTSTEECSALHKKPPSFFHQFDYLFSIANDVYIRPSILSAVRVKAINYHNGPLPRYAGLNADHWAMARGEKVHGVTWHEMEAEIDAGPLLATEPVMIEEHDSISTLKLKCKAAAEKALDGLCQALRQNRVEPTPQNLAEREVFRAPDRPSPFCFLNFSKYSAEDLQNLFRASSTTPPQENIFGLPKLLLPGGNVIIPTQFQITKSVHQLGPAIISVEDNCLLIPSQSHLVKVSGLLELDGAQVTLPYSDSLGHLQGKEMPAVDNSEQLFSSISEVACQYEGVWVKNYNKRVSSPPLTWPYFPYVTHAVCDQRKESQLCIPKHIIEQLLFHFQDYSSELVTMASLTAFLLCLSPTLTGSIDIKCKLTGVPQQVRVALLNYFPCAFQIHYGGQEMHKLISSVLEKQKRNVNGSVLKEKCIRKEIVAADVYLRRPIQKNNNQIMMEVRENNTHKFQNSVTSHDMKFAFYHSEGSVYIHVSSSGPEITSCTFEDDFLTFLNQVASDPTLPVSEYSVSSSSSSSLVSQLLAGPEMDVQRTWLQKEFERKAMTMPHTVAIIDEWGQYTYNELNMRANEIAVALLHVVKDGNQCHTHTCTCMRVAVVLERTWELVACLVAVLKIGGCFVLIDKNNTEDYIMCILEDCKPDVIVFDTLLVAYSYHTICGQFVDAITSLDKLYSEQDFVRELPMHPKNPAMVLYTSGTTGTPKGVILEHRGYCNYLQYVIELLHKDPATPEYIVSVCSVSFDGFIHEVFSALWTGSTLLMCPANPAETSRCFQFLPYVTLMITQPVKLSLFDLPLFQSLHALGVGGEAVSMEALKSWTQPHRKIWNFYGPTETSIASSISLVADKIHIGGIRANTKYKILNSLMQSLPKGVQGEMHIGGVGVAVGYTSEEATKECFWQDESGRWYRTGDMVYIDKDNDLQIVGRIPGSRQVKIHGYRIELQGIEHVLRNIPGVEFAHVSVEQISANVKQLVAYVYPSAVDIPKVSSILKQRLPRYMQPHRVFTISAMDFTSTGKMIISKQDVCEYDRFVAPRNDTELQVLTLFRSVLGITEDHMFGMQHSFVEMGGDSVTAVHLASKIKDQTNWVINPFDLLGKLKTPASVISCYHYQKHFVAPSNDTDSHVLKLFHHVLGITEDRMFGMDHSFIEMGGDSVVAVHLASKIKDQMNWDIDPFDLLGKLKTPADVISHYRNQESQIPEPGNLASEQLTERQLSFMQKNFLSMNSYVLGPAYSIPIHIDLKGHVNTLSLSSVLNASLKYFVSALDNAEDGYQEAYVTHVDYSDLPHDEALGLARQAVQKDAVIPIDFLKCPFRCTVYMIGSEHTIVSVVVHHIVADAVSVNNFVQRVGHLYLSNDYVQAISNEVYQPFWNYIEFEEYQSVEHGVEISRFWRKHFISAKPHINFPTSFTRPKQCHYTGQRIELELSKDIVVRIEEICKEFEVLAPCFYFVSFCSVIFALSQQPHFCVGVVTNCRRSSEMWKVMGCATATLPFCATKNMLESSVARFMCDFHSWLQEASKMAFISTTELFRMIGAEKDNKYHFPQFLFNYNVSNHFDSTLHLGEQVVTKKELVPTYTCKCEVLLDIQSGDETTLFLEYDSSLFSTSRAEVILSLIGDEIVNALNSFSGTVAAPSSSYTHFEDEITPEELLVKEVEYQHNNFSFDDRQKAIFEEVQELPIDMHSSMHCVLTISIPKGIDLQKALMAMLSKWSTLSLIVNFKDEGFQKPPKTMRVPCTYENASSQEGADGILYRDMYWPFDLSQGPLVRFTVISSKKDQKTVVLCCHQILLDPCHMEILGMEVAQYPAAVAMVTPDHFVTETHTDSYSTGTELHSSFWNKKLDGVGYLTSPDVSLEQSRHRLHANCLVEDTSSWSLVDNELCLSAAFAVLLSYCTHSGPNCGAYVAVFAPVPSGNSYKDIIIPLCMRLDLSESFANFVKRVESELREAVSHYVSFWKLQKQYFPGSSYLKPFIQTAVRTSNIATENLKLRYNHPYKVFIEFKYRLSQVSLVSNLPVKQTSAVQKLFRTLVGKFSSMLESRTEKLVILPSLSDHKHWSTQLKFKGTQKEVDDLRKVVTTPFAHAQDKVAYAVVSSTTSYMTYRELHRQVEWLKQKIKMAIDGVSISELVAAILTEGGIECPIAVVMSVLCGIPFIVLDSQEETEVLQQKVSASNTNVLLVAPEMIHKALHIAEANICISVIPITLFQEVKFPPTPSQMEECVNLLPSHCFLVFTSGSTGKPKGVPIPCDSLSNFLHWHTRFIKTDQAIYWLQYSGVSFDMYVAEVLGQLVLHNTLLLVPQKRKLDVKYLVSVLKSFYIGGLYTIPTVFTQFLRHSAFSQNYLASMKHIACTGEQLHGWQCQVFFLKFQQNTVCLHNWGGPSECAIAVSHLVLSDLKSLDVVPIGGTVDNCKVVIVKPDTFDVLPCYIPGEVLIHGLPLFSGYLDRSAQKSSLVSINNEVWFRSGDVGYLNTRNELVLLYRLDRQVKVAGRRTELPGVENMIRNLHLPYLKDVIVDYPKLEKLSSLICFPLTSEEVSEERVQHDIARGLPRRYLPIVVKCFREYPRLLSGKVHKRKLLSYAESKPDIHVAHHLHSNDARSYHLSVLKSCIDSLLPSPLCMDRAATLSLDMLGFSSIMKTELHQMLLDKGFDVNMTTLLMSKSLEELALRLYAKKSAPSSESVDIDFPLQSKRKDSVAITMMEVKIPEAYSLSEFWDLLCSKKEAISHDLPYDQSLLGKKGAFGRYVGSRGILQDKDLFDAELFGISPNQAQLMDPQHRLLLETVWTALENAGCDPVRYKQRGKIGCFASIQFPTYILNTLLYHRTRQEQHIDQIVFGCTKDNAALIIARIFDFHGPCITVADNCASFSVALHLARHSLLLGECDMAVVVGSTVVAHNTGYIYRESDIYSKDGHCCPFSISASGTVMSDGIVVLILKRLEDAEQERDSVYCLLRETAVGSDGASMKLRTYVPSPSGQKENLFTLFSHSNIKPADITFVEAHGSGTRLGDQVELESLSDVFTRLHFPADKTCLLGSVKGNVGHLGVNASAPAIVKAVLALKNGQLPPTLNFDRPIPDLSKSPFEINISVVPLPPQAIPHRALVHSIGALGINSALILEEYCAPEAAPEPGQQQDQCGQLLPLCMSANSEHALKQLCSKLSHTLKNDNASLHDISFTLLVSRQFLAKRQANVFLDGDREGVISWLQQQCTDMVSAKRTQNETTVLLSGQGTSFSKKEFCELCTFSSPFKENAEMCIKIMKSNWPEHCGDLESVMNPDCATHALNENAVEQCMIIITQIGLYKILVKLGLTANLFCGHSLGEYTAAHLCGAFTLEEVINVVFKRGLLMQQYCPPNCGMLSVHCSGTDFKSLFNTHKESYDIEISCWNSPKHCVVSGPLIHLEHVMSLLREQGIKCDLLPMAYSFHHSGAQTVRSAFLTYLEQNISMHPLKCIFVSSLQGRNEVISPSDTIPHAYWIDHLTTAVDFTSVSLLHVLQEPILELGIKPVLRSFLRASQPKLQCSALTLVSRANANYELTHLNMITDLWKKGINLELNKLDVFQYAKLTKLPTYQFDHAPYWISVDESRLDLPFDTAVKADRIREVIPSSVLEFLERNIGAHDETVENSMDQMYLYEKVFDTYQVSILELLQRRATLKEISHYIVEHCVIHAGKERAKPHVHAFAERENTERLFVINASDGNVFSFRALATLLSQHFSVYGLFDPALVRKATSVKECAQVYLQVITDMQSEGPYLIAGFSFGAWIAHAIVAELEVENKVGVLVLLDPPYLPDVLCEYSSLNLSLMIAMGSQLIRKHIDGPDHDKIDQYGQNFSHHTRLLANYNLSCSKVMCRTAVIVAEDRISTDGTADKITKVENWSRYCDTSQLSLDVVPGMHNTFISSPYCHNVYAKMAQRLSLPEKDVPWLPVRSSCEVAKSWTLTMLSVNECELTEHQLKKLYAHSVLRIGADDTYTCAVPFLVCYFLLI